MIGVPRFGIRSFTSFSKVSQEAVTKLLKKEKIVKNILYCTFGQNNTHLALVSVVNDENFLKNNPDLSYNDKVMYYLRPPQKMKIHLSAGSVGFKKAARGEYEAAYQTTAKMFQLIEERQYTHDLDIVMREFGKGRTAFTDALKGKEGTFVRKFVKSLADATKIKFGGVRSPAPRRL